MVSSLPFDPLKPFKSLLCPSLLLLSLPVLLVLEIKLRNCDGSTAAELLSLVYCPSGVFSLLVCASSISFRTVCAELIDDASSGVVIPRSSLSPTHTAVRSTFQGYEVRFIINPLASNYPCPWQLRFSSRADRKVLPEKKWYTNSCVSLVKMQRRNQRFSIIYLIGRSGLFTCRSRVECD